MLTTGTPLSKSPFFYLLLCVFSPILGILRQREKRLTFAVSRLFCGYYRRDSNPYSLYDREILSLLRLPFRHCSIGVGGIETYLKGIDKEKTWQRAYKNMAFPKEISHKERQVPILSEIR